MTHDEAIDVIRKATQTIRDMWSEYDHRHSDYEQGYDDALSACVDVIHPVTDAVAALNSLAKRIAELELDNREGAELLAMQDRKLIDRCKPLNPEAQTAVQENFWALAVEPSEIGEVDKLTYQERDARIRRECKAVGEIAVTQIKGRYEAGMAGKWHSVDYVDGLHDAMHGYSAAIMGKEAGE